MADKEASSKVVRVALAVYVAKEGVAVDRVVASGAALQEGPEDQRAGPGVNFAAAGERKAVLVELDGASGLVFEGSAVKAQLNVEVVNGKHRREPADDRVGPAHGFGHGQDRRGRPLKIRLVGVGPS